MCINDLYTTGAHPLFFLDYYASGKLSKDQFKEVLSSIKKGLEIASCPLMGGETAELPGLYQGSHFDLAGFVVGVVDEENLINPSLVKKTDILYALPSSGFHSNGYSLLRKWLKDKPALHTKENLDFLLTPTRIYPEILTLLKKLPRNTIHGIAHITGGGISGNLPRVLPKDLDAAIKLNDLPTPPIMKKFIEGAGFSVADVEPTFNLGCGMILSVASENIMAFEKESDALQLSAKRIGYLKENLNSGEAKVIYE